MREYYTRLHSIYDYASYVLTYLIPILQNCCVIIIWTILDNFIYNIIKIDYNFFYVSCEKKKHVYTSYKYVYVYNLIQF